LKSYKIVTHVNKNVTKFLFTNVLNAKNIDEEERRKLIPYFTKNWIKIFQR